MRLLILLLMIGSFVTTLFSALISARPLTISSKGLGYHNHTRMNPGIAAKSLNPKADSYVSHNFRQEQAMASTAISDGDVHFLHRSLEEPIRREKPANLRLRTPPGYPPLPGVSPPLLNVICDTSFQVVTGPALWRLLNQAITLAFEQARLHPLAVLPEDGFGLKLYGYSIDILPREEIFLTWYEVARAFLGILGIFVGERQYELSRWHLRK